MIELKHKRSARERHYRLPNGQMRAEVGSADINYLNHDGRGDGETGWRKVDINPTETEHGWVQEFCHYRMVAPLTADGVASYSQTWGDGKIKNRGVTFQAVGALPVQGVRGIIDASQAVIYPDAFGEGVDLVYCFYVSGIGKYVRVRAGYTGASYQFKIGTGDKVERIGQNSYEVLRTGKKTLDTARMTSIGGDMYLRPITARWGENSQVLPVDIEPVAGGWVVTKTTPQAWDGSADLYMDLTTTGTLAANANSCVFNSYTTTATPSQSDWDTAHDAASGSVVDSGDPSAMFVTAYWKNNSPYAYRIWRGFQAWSLAIPGAIITAADIVLNASIVARSDDVYAVAGSQASTSTLALSDYSLVGSTSFGSVAIGASTGNKTITLNASGIAHINVNGTTKFAFLQDSDFEDNRSANSTTGTSEFNAFGSYESGTAPILNVTYTLPAGGVPSGLMLMGVG